MRTIGLNLPELSDVLLFARTVVNYIRYDPKLVGMQVFWIVLRSAGALTQAKYVGIDCDHGRFGTDFVHNPRVPIGVSLADFGSAVGLLIEMAHPQDGLEYRGTQRDNGDVVVSFGRRNRKPDPSNRLFS